MKLSGYPFIIVRLACDLCARRGQYRLARLAQAFGAEAPLEHVIDRLSADCPWRLEARSRREPCGARCVDLQPPRMPPDLPADMRKFTVVKGGKG